MGSPLAIKFWGTRGLVPSPRKDTAQYGGNTPCIQILYKNHVILVDTGFGVSNLGEILMNKIIKNKEQFDIHIFYTHFHWDHVQGLPFFHPIYFATTNIYIYSPYDEQIMKQNLDILFDGSYSPFSGIDSMPSKIKIEQLKGLFQLDDLRISFQAVDHGTNGKTRTFANAYSYKFETSANERLCIITDHEAQDSKINDELIQFAKGSDLVVHDAQYTIQEYKKYRGWGHSNIRQALNNVIKMKTKQCLLTHHDPGRSDKQIDQISKLLSKDRKYKNLTIEFARENLVYEVNVLENLTSEKKAS